MGRFQRLSERLCPRGANQAEEVLGEVGTLSDGEHARFLDPWTAFNPKKYNY